MDKYGIVEPNHAYSRKRVCHAVTQKSHPIVWVTWCFGAIQITSNENDN